MPDIITEPERGFQVDLTDVGKGHVFTRPEIEAIVRIPWTDPRYGIRVLKLKQHIENQMADMGIIVVCAIRKGDLHVLDDADASGYTYDQFKHGLRQAARNHRRMQSAVDQAALTQEQRSAHLRRLTVTGAIMQAVNQTRRELAVTPQKKLPATNEQA